MLSSCDINFMKTQCVTTTMLLFAPSSGSNLSASAPSHAPTSDRPFCTQQCLVGLGWSGAMDRDCPMISDELGGCLLAVRDKGHPQLGHIGEAQPVEFAP